MYCNSFFPHTDQLMIIMEYACFGNLQNYLKERSPGDEYFYLREKSCPRKGENMEACTARKPLCFTRNLLRDHIEYG